MAKCNQLTSLSFKGLTMTLLHCDETSLTSVGVVMGFTSITVCML